MTGRLLRGFFIASGALLCMAGAVALSKRRNRPMSAKTTPAHSQSKRSDFFSLTRSRSKDPCPKWVLQGYGRYTCFLLFDSWEEAMRQANFRLEKLGSAVPELIQIVSRPGK